MVGEVVVVGDVVVADVLVPARLADGPGLGTVVLVATPTDRLSCVDAPVLWVSAACVIANHDCSACPDTAA